MTAILAIDTASGPCSAAVWAGGRIAAYAENVKPVMQSASLMPLVEDALAQAGLGYDDLSLVAATTGPGSFTGIRVGLAAARGIAFAAGLPTAGYTTLEVLAFAGGDRAENMLAALNAGKGEWYYQGFSQGLPLFEPQVGAPDIAAASIAAPALFAGNVPAPAGLAALPVTFPRADLLAGLAARFPAAAQPVLTPFYIRAPDAKLPCTT